MPLDAPVTIPSLLDNLLIIHLRSRCDSPCPGTSIACESRRGRENISIYAHYACSLGGRSKASSTKRETFGFMTVFHRRNIRQRPSNSDRDKNRLQFSMKPTVRKANLSFLQIVARILEGILGVGYRQPNWITMIPLVLVCLGSHDAWCQYSPASGPYKVLTVDNIALHDLARDKYIPIKIYYPDGVGPFPVIIFSHGALASKDNYSAFGQFWASSGYVSIHPSHADSIVDSHFRGSLRDAISDPHAWPNRPEDISFIIDSLTHVEKFAPQLVGKLDLRHIGVGGHSFGAYTAGLIAGTTILLPRKAEPQSFADKRVSAVVMLSPQGEGIMGLSAHSWEP